MNTQLYINSGKYLEISGADINSTGETFETSGWTLLDLSEDVDVLLTYSISDVKNPFDKKTSFSKTITVPDSPNNRNIFKKLFNLNIVQGTWSTVRVEAILYNDGWEVFRGYIKLNNVIRDGGVVEYECNLLSYTKSLFVEIKNNKIEELEWDGEGEHTYSFATVSNNNYDSDTKPFIYPFVDWGYFNTGITSDASTFMTRQMQNMNTVDKNEFFKPAVFVKSIIDKIFENKGFTYECEFFETEWFKKLVIPYSKNSLNYSNTTDLIGDADVNGRFILKAKYPFLAFGGSLDIHTDLYGSISNNLKLYIGGLGPNVYSSIQSGIENYVLRKDFSKIDINVSFTRVSGLADLYVGIYAQGGELLSYKRIVDIDATTNNYNETITLTENLEKDNIIVFSIIHGSVLDLEIENFNFKVYDKETTGVLWNSVSKLTMNDIMPKNIKQSDFLRDILKLFNLYVVSDDENKNNYIIKSREDYYKNGKSVDWSDKLMRNMKVTINTNISDVGFVDFAFKEGDDYHNNIFEQINNRGFGELNLNTNNKYSKDVERYESIFTATPYISSENVSKYMSDDKFIMTVTRLDNTSTDKYYPIAKIGWETENGVEGETIPSGSVLKRAKCNSGIRLLELITFEMTDEDLKFNDSEVFNYYTTCISNSFDGSGIDINFSPDCGTFVDLTGGTLYYKYTNLYDYHDDIISNWLNKDARLIEAYFRLNPSDIFSFSLSDKVYVNFGELIDSGWFIINSIKDYDLKTGICKIELLKIIKPENYSIEYEPLIVQDVDIIIHSDDTINTIVHTDATPNTIISEDF